MSITIWLRLPLSKFTNWRYYVLNSIANILSRWSTLLYLESYSSICYMLWLGFRVRLIHFVAIIMSTFLLLRLLWLLLLRLLLQLRIIMLITSSKLMGNEISRLRKRTMHWTLSIRLIDWVWLSLRSLNIRYFLMPICWIDLVFLSGSRCILWFWKRGRWRVYWIKFIRLAFYMLLMKLS